MKILLLSLSGAFGGMEIRMLQEAKLLKENGYTVEIGISSFESQARFMSAAKDLDVHCFILDIPPFFEKWRLRHLNLAKAYLFSVPAIKRKQYDLAHVFMPWTDQSGSRLWVCAKAGVPTVLSIHGDFSNTPSFSDLQKKLLATAVPNIRNTFAVSESAKSNFLNHFQEFFSSVANPVQVIPNYVDSSVFKADKTTSAIIRRELGLGENDFVAGYIGRLDKRKNIAETIKAFTHFHHLHSSSKLLIVGYGPESNTLVNLCEELNISNAVLFLGFQRDIAKYFQCLDVSIFLSEGEGFGISAIESMACQVPVVCNDAPGLSEIVSHSNNGYLMKKDDQESIGKLLYYLAQNPDVLTTMGQAGRKTVLEKYDVDVFESNILNFYKGIQL